MKINAYLGFLLGRRHGGAFILLFYILLTTFFTRIALIIKSAPAIDFNTSLVAAMGWGLLFDLALALLLTLPVVLLLTALPGRCFQQKWFRFLAFSGFFVAGMLLLFGSVSEWLFWDEFSARFNFIAVDYLVYTTEVIKNIRESYPLPWIFLGLFVGGAVIQALLVRSQWVNRWLEGAGQPGQSRWGLAGVWLVVTAVGLAGMDTNRLPLFANNYNREIAKNGLWSLFAAFRNNELDYEQFYSTLPIDKAFERMHAELAQDASRSLSGNLRDTLSYVKNTGTPLYPNVIQITVESLSAKFLGAFNPKSHLTPNLDSLAARSMVFDNFYATGTRTDRGMEALTLSIPPTPGRSLVKRPHNENLFTLGSVFRNRGYDTAFIYGGFGYFDNMNYFFGNNGYRVVDRNSVNGKDITFANAWGACDEDLFRWTLREADGAHSNGVPFFHFVMTTSNHRPYTYPAGRIDLPSKVSGRDGAVKYTDYAIGKFIRDASTRPWFSNTVFVIVADHCASVAGKSELPIENYHIPLLIYSPGGQMPLGHVKDLASQVDYAPTLLGLLNWSYSGRFYGWDVRKATGDRRALIGNYQRLGLFEPGTMTVLKPQRQIDEFTLDPVTFAQKTRNQASSDSDEAIAYYQTASYLYQHRLYKAVPTDAKPVASRQDVRLEQTR